MGCGQNINEERIMRLNNQVMVRLKEGSHAYGEMNHGHKMENRVLTRMPMKGWHYRIGCNV
jgi:hypothetical protein